MQMQVSGSYPFGDIFSTASSITHIPHGIASFGIISRMKRKPVREVLAANIRSYMASTPAIDTQIKLAKKAGISQSSVARVLAGKVDTQIGIVDALAAAIGIPPGTLIDDPEIAPTLLIDRERFAQLPPEERAKMQSYVDFVLAQTQSEGDALSFNQKLTQEPEQQQQARGAARRPISHDTLSIHEKRDEHSPRRKGG